jgi:hypothetical protein
VKLTRLGLLLLLCAMGCAKKEPKPLRTEPWLAHPPASASASDDAGLPLTRYLIEPPSVIRFELATRRGALRGSITRVSGELDVDLSDLTRSHGLVRADLGSLEIHADAGTEDSHAALLERARAALELSPDAHASTAFASFELTSVEDAAPGQIEPAPEQDAGSAFSRRARFAALGNLLLHGFRVARRAPLEAEFSFAGNRQLPSRVLIRSRTPFVVSLETHAIVALVGESGSKAPSAAPARARDAHVTVELYGTKGD